MSNIYVIYNTKEELFLDVTGTKVNYLYKDDIILSLCYHRDKLDILIELCETHDEALSVIKRIAYEPERTFIIEEGMSNFVGVRLLADVIEGYPSRVGVWDRMVDWDDIVEFPK